MVIAIKKECSIESREELRVRIHLFVYGVRQNNTYKLTRASQLVFDFPVQFIYDQDYYYYYYDKYCINLIIMCI